MADTTTTPSTAHSVNNLTEYLFYKKKTPNHILPTFSATRDQSEERTVRLLVPDHVFDLLADMWEEDRLNEGPSKEWKKKLSTATAEDAIGNYYGRPANAVSDHVFPGQNTSNGEHVSNEHGHTESRESAHDYGQSSTAGLRSRARSALSRRRRRDGSE